MIFNDIKTMLETGDGKNAILELADRIDDLQDQIKDLHIKIDKLK
jgi:hypothetical protein